MKIPAGPDALTADWLTSALREGGAVDTANVTSFKAEPLAGDKGFRSQIVRLSLDYDLYEAGAPKSVIAKFSSVAPEMRKRSNGLYEREVRFYQQLAPRTALPTPACYYSDVDTDAAMHVLLLEDLAPACSGSRVAGCSAEQAEMAVHQIAEFHATWWDKPQLDEISWMTNPDANLDPDAERDEFNGWWPYFVEQADHRLTNPIKKIGECMGERWADIRREVFDTPPLTLIHRDYHLDNLVFGTPEGGRPFAVVDWQSISPGRGMWDVAYFLCQSLTPEVRREIEMGLLEGYCQILADNGVQGYTFDQCMHDYKLSLLHRFGRIVSTIAVMPFTSEQLQMHIDVLLPRNAAAILDHNAGELLS